MLAYEHVYSEEELAHLLEEAGGSIIKRTDTHLTITDASNLALFLMNKSARGWVLNTCVVRTSYQSRSNPPVRTK